MAKYTVLDNGTQVHHGRGKNDAYCFAGEYAKVVLPTGDLGMIIEVCKDGKVTLTYTLIQRHDLRNNLVRDWNVAIPVDS